jgi:hypothetical protein
VAESDPPRHPLDMAEVPREKAYEWMLARCAELEASRQAREDGLIATITQISSGALLLIPTILLSKDSKMPSFDANKLFYFGVSGFVLSLVAALLEQYLSGKAYAKQVEVTQAYYLKQSVAREDSESLGRLRLARRVAYISFFLSVICVASGIMVMR